MSKSSMELLDLAMVFDLELLWGQLSPMQQYEAMSAVFETVELPPRGPHGSKVNLNRMAIFTRALLEELKKRAPSKG